MSLPSRQVIRGSATVAIGAAGGTAVEFAGSLREADDGAWLLGIVDEVHGAAVASGMLEVVLDIRKLEYCNAAAWKGFVVWLRKIRETPGARYRLRVRSEPKHRWQVVGMAALRPFGADRLIIE